MQLYIKNEINEYVSECFLPAVPPRMHSIPPVAAILALDSLAAEPILMHLRPSRETIMQPRPSSIAMIIRARQACT